MNPIIGIDPGKTGAFAVLDRESGRLIDVHDMPVAGQIISSKLLADLAHLYRFDSHPDRPGIACIEDVHSMPKQGVATMFSFGRSLGIAEGVFAGSGWSMRYVSPQKWKKALGLSTDKGVSRRRAIELWPSSSDLFARVKDDGRAEAALIAFWWLNFGDGAQ
jgi:crossover junction endodeoxyribonuclease RuvC